MGSSTDWVPSLWSETFEEMKDDELDYEDQWTLNFNYSITDKVTKEERKRGWKVYCTCPFGNLKCKACGRAWSSARLLVVFRYRLRGARGTVVMRPFKQACRNCSTVFVLPGFHKKEVEEALERLILKIRKNCYGEDVGDNSHHRRPHKMTKPHETSLCEACKMGICSECDDDITAE